MVFGFAAPAGAVTIADLQAQIASLMAQLQSLQGGSASAAISSDLTVGSSGSQVVALQTALVNGHYLVIPAGVPMGYFGSLTKAAVMSWQAANGLPATGFFGPLSRAKFGGSAPGTTTGGPVYSGSSVAACAVPGAEGTLTVTTGTISNSTVYAGDTNAPILAFKAKATGSDLSLQRVKIDLGTASAIYSKVYSKIYLVDDNGGLVASSDLNSNTVVKETVSGTDHYMITLSGFSSVVPKDATRNYTVKVDVRSISSGSSDLTSHTVRLAANGVRATDCAGIDQYAPSSATDVSKDVTAAATLADSATLSLSTDSATPLAQEVIASGGASSNEADKVAILSFDLAAQKDNVLVTDLVATVSRSGGAATASTTYLYAGDTLIGSASASGSSVTFSDINYTVPKDSTKSFTLKSDVRSANSTATTLSASVATSGITAENSNGDAVSGSSLSGSATSNSITVRNVGPVFTLVSKGITTNGVPENNTSGGANYSTSTLTATFKVHVVAQGADITFGSVASATPAFASSTTGFKVYVNGAANTALNAAAVAQSSWDTPSSGVTNLASQNSFTLAKNNPADITVSFVLLGRNAATGAVLSAPGASTYAVGLEGIQWQSVATGPTSSTFMAGLTDWRTSAVTFP